MGLRSLARALAVAACAGCTLLAGLDDPVSPGDDGGTDNPTPPRADASVDAADAAPCQARVSPLAGSTLKAFRAEVEPTIDGVFSDWECVDRVDVGEGDFTKGIAPGGPQAVQFGFVWSPTALYFHARVTTTAPGLEHTPADQFFRNDSVHLVLGPSPVAGDGRYRPVDYQFVFDHRGSAGAYRGGMLLNQIVIEAKVTPIPEGPGLTFHVEARFPPAFFQLPVFERGNRFAFNVQFFDPSTLGGAQVYRVWRLGACSCRICCTNDPKGSPTCDMGCTETLELD
ncbi:MAG: hypothetical protein KF819_03430 [Labilithrix sp.]|nr:hypothetical protein [Labilithrix sp.]